MLTPEQIEQDKKLDGKMDQIKNKIIVLSGKGGVGKSTVSVNLAFSLVMKGYRVGLLDTDLHGPNVGKMLGLEGETLTGADKIINPVETAGNLKVMSMAFSGNHPDDPIIWRGPMKMGVIKQFLADVEWGELDYLIIDSPPGTGDEPLTVCQNIKNLTGAVIVTSPQDVAILDSRKSISFARKLDIPVMGVVENMSGLICPHCGEAVPLFGEGGGEKAADDMSVPFLGKIPLDPAVVSCGDSGRPYIESYKDSPVAQAMDVMVGKIVEGSVK